MEDYPYSSYYISEDRMRFIPADVRTSSVTTWIYSSSPRPTTEFMYYDDEGRAKSRTFIVPADHDLGIDTVPALVEEGLGVDGQLNGAMAPLWISIHRNRLNGFNEIVGILWTRGTFFEQGGKIIEREGIIHRDAFFRDIGQALPFISPPNEGEEVDKPYQYTRSSLLIEGWSMKNQNRMLYYPLSVLASLIRGDKVEFMTPNRFEYDCLTAIKSYPLLEDRGSEGIYLNRAPFIRRTGIFQWLSIAHELLQDMVKVEKGARKVVVMELGNTHEYIRGLKGKDYERVYVLSRTAYADSLVPLIPIQEMKDAGYEYRGPFIYRVTKLKSIMYPIFFFSKKHVNPIFPVILNSQSNNDAPVFPTEIPFDYSDRSTGLVHLLPQVIKEGSISWYGAVWQSSPSRLTSLSLRRDDKRNYFITCLLPDNLPLKEIEWENTDMDEVTHHFTYHDPLLFTTIPIYKGPIPDGKTHSLTKDWKLTHSGYTWYLHSRTAKDVPRLVWEAITRLQGSIATLPQVRTRMMSKLSYSSLVRHWSSLRYQDDEKYALTWNGTTRQYVSKNSGLTNESIGCINGFGVYMYYSLPIQTDKASPSSNYPLPTLQEGIKMFYRESEGRLISYTLGGEGEVEVEVKNGRIIAYDPYNIVDHRVKKEDGIYRAKLKLKNNELIWTIASSSSSILPWKSEEITDYILSFLHEVTEDDLSIPPNNRLVTIHSPVHLSGNTMDTRTLDSVTVDLASNTARGYQSLLGRSDPSLVSIGESSPNLIETKIRDITLHTKNELTIEYTYSATPSPISTLLQLDDLNWKIEKVPRRRLVAVDDVNDEYTARYYEIEEGEEMETSAEIDSLTMYWRDPIGAENDELVLENVRVVSRGELNLEALKDVATAL